MALAGYMIVFANLLMAAVAHRARLYPLAVLNLLVAIAILRQLWSKP